MKIVKMHGLGNDFILIDNRSGELQDKNALAARLCRRRLSVGADGLITVEPSQCADIRMRIYNSDGSEAEMCGNGIRCFARLVYDMGIVRGEEFSVETLAGIMRPKVITDAAGSVSGVRVDMGMPDFTPENVPMKAENALEARISAAGSELSVHCCLMGVPHAIVIVDGSEVTEEDFMRLGPAIESHEIFPRKINVNFARIIDKNNVAVRTWERGAGPTLACGTGSCATVCVLSEMGLLERSADVHLAAGTLHIEYGDTVYMTGAAEYVFKGEAL